MAKKFTNKDVLKMVEENDVKFIRLQFTDLFGILKNVAITARQLATVLENGAMFDGSSIDGFARIQESDMILKPDTDTFEIFPWRPQQGKVARLICDVCTTDGESYVGCPRGVLKKVLARAEKMGYAMNVGPEAEFFLFQQDENGDPTLETHDVGGYFDMAPVDKGEDARREMSLTLEQMGFEIEASHHEVAQGQHEIDFKYGEALKVADGIMTFKLVVKTIAQRHGLFATFMPKPIFGINGSGMHCNMSLSTKDGNAFADPKDEMGLSKVAYNYIAGLLSHLKSIAAVTNPTVNSYKRLVPGYEAPSYLAWSGSNRTAIVRIPAARGAGTRVELRCPDPTTNPYLAIALMLSAGLDGIEKGMEAPAPVNKNIFAMTDEEMKAINLDCLPDSLAGAMVEFNKSELVKEVLGDHIFEAYSSYKQKEWDEFRTAVHPWEIDKYIAVY
jgi:glutamine synthetase